jgi:hypothetical protein
VQDPDKIDDRIHAIDEFAQLRGVVDIRFDHLDARQHQHVLDALTAARRYPNMVAAAAEQVDQVTAYKTAAAEDADILELHDTALLESK